jgi:thioredoxin reductase (NADPH)
MAEIWDAIIVGAGPAGLSAALYLARFRRSTLVIHDGRSRAAQIPLTHNVPGCPSGVCGERLLSRMTRHAVEYGAALVGAHVESASICDRGFALRSNDGTGWSCRALVLATGVDQNDVPIEARARQAAIDAGVLRYCPICDGYEHIGQRIAVIGCDRQGAGEALFLRRYSADVTLIPRRYADLDSAILQKLLDSGVRVLKAPVARFIFREREMRLQFQNGAGEAHFDVVYPALGLHPRCKLATELGLAVDDAGALGAESIFGTKVPGLYAAGDVVAGLDQISVAMGHGAIAATKAHNWLRDQDGQALER